MTKVSDFPEASQPNASAGQRWLQNLGRALQFKTYTPAISVDAGSFTGTALKVCGCMLINRLCFVSVGFTGTTTSTPTGITFSAPAPIDTNMYALIPATVSQGAGLVNSYISVASASSFVIRPVAGGTFSATTIGVGATFLYFAAV